MKKEVKIITIIDNKNYGNRLQNYALEKYLKTNYNVSVETLNNDPSSNTKKLFFLRKLKKILIPRKNIVDERYKKFSEFNKNINLSEKIYTVWNHFDCYGIVGSDQVWNPRFRRLTEFDLLSSFDADKRISYAASFGIENLEKKEKNKIEKALLSFKGLSVREDAGKKIIEDVTKRKDVKVLIDPTMLLRSEEWDKVSKKPEMLKTNKYILNYFLGNVSESITKEINRIAEDNNCEIINLLDKNSPFYTCGPSEFLYLEKNAFLICTDSFHSSVFAILYNRPFIVFKREGKSGSMFSRIETLLDKFQLKNRLYNGKCITRENINHDYSKAYKIIEEEKNKSDAFLKNALDIEDGE